MAGFVKCNRVEEIIRELGIDDETLSLNSCQIEDFSWISKYQRVTDVYINHNTKVKDISPILELPSLRVLSIMDTPKVTKIEFGYNNNSITELVLAGGIWKPLVLNSIGTIRFLENLESLQILNVKIVDDDITPIGNLQKLADCTLSNMWPIEQFAHIERCTGGRIKFNQPFGTLFAGSCTRCGGSIDMMLGRKSKTLCPVCDKVKWSKQIERYHDMVDKKCG